MSRKPSVRLLSHAIVGLLIVIPISLFLVIQGLYMTQKNAMNSGQEQLMQTVNYVTNNIKLAIENRSLALADLLEDTPSSSLLIEEELSDPTRKRLHQYFERSEGQTDRLFYIDKSGVIKKAWHYDKGSLVELPYDEVESYVQSDKTFKELLNSGEESNNSKEYFLNGIPYINLYSWIEDGEGEKKGLFISPLQLEKLFHLKIYTVVGKYSGYPMVKNGEMEVVMHPVAAQLGLNIIEGREKQFPDLDLSDLKRLEKIQLNNTEGKLSYYSYWWNEKHPRKVLKLEAFQWINIGKARWVVALNSDFYEHNRIPIQNSRILLSILLLIFAIIVVFFILMRSYQKRDLAYEENQRLLEKQKSDHEKHILEKKLYQENKLETIGLLTTTIVHDMNNFLTPILGNCQLLMEEYADREELVSELEEIYQAAEKGKQLSTNVLRFSKVENNNSSEIFCLSEVVEEAVNTIAKLAPKSIQITKDITKKIGKVEFEKQDLQIIIYNLLTNAFQAIEEQEGEVMVCLSIADKKWNSEFQKRSYITKNKKYALLSITDNGPGIDKGMKAEDLLRPFVTTKAEEGGGLGLFVVSSIADKYDWQIRVIPEQKGLTILIGIPLIKEKN